MSVPKNAKKSLPENSNKKNTKRKPKNCNDKNKDHHRKLKSKTDNKQEKLKKTTK
jgi:hypothetical protein